MGSLCNTLVACDYSDGVDWNLFYFIALDLGLRKAQTFPQGPLEKSGRFMAADFIMSKNFWLRGNKCGSSDLVQMGELCHMALWGSIVDGALLGGRRALSD